MGERALVAGEAEIEDRGFRWSVFFISMAVAVLLTLVIAVVGFESTFADRIYPGVWVEGVPLGGLTRPQAETLLRERAPYYREGRIEFRYRDRKWTHAPETLGAQLDTGRMVGEAFALGRNISPLEDLRQQAALFLYGYSVAPVTTFSPEHATAIVQNIAREIDTPVQDASLKLDGTRVVTASAVVGLKTDVLAAVDAVQSRVIARGEEPVELVVDETPPVLPDVSKTAAQLQAMLASPIQLVPPSGVTASQGKNEWRIEPADLAGMIQILREPAGDGKDHLTIRLDESRLTPAVAPIAPAIFISPTNARLDWDVSANRLVVLQSSRDGQSLDVPETVRRIVARVPTATHKVELAVKSQKATVDSSNLPALGIVEVAAEGSSNFKGSAPGRIKNIEVAASKFDGVLVPPGTVFSFNDNLGDVSAANGYEDAYVIINNRTRLGVGGGVCQVSTTAFRAAFFGGYPIVERWAHDYRVKYYEPPVGLDATVYGPVVDLKFKNDQDTFILIKTFVDKKRTTVTFRFYGTKPDRHVTLEGPIVKNVKAPGPTIYEDDPNLPAGQLEQVDWAVAGADVTVTRVIKQNGGETREPFASHYEAWRAIFKRGTKAENVQAPVAQ